MIYVYIKEENNFGIISSKPSNSELSRNAGVKLVLPKSTLFNIAIEPNYSKEFLLTISFTYGGEDYLCKYVVDNRVFSDLISQTDGIDGSFNLRKNGFMFDNGNYKLKENHLALYESFLDDFVEDVAKINAVKPIIKSKLAPFTIYKDVEGVNHYLIGNVFIGKGDSKKLLFLDSEFAQSRNYLYASDIVEAIFDGHTYTKDTSNLVETVNTFSSLYSTTKGLDSLCYAYNLELFKQNLSTTRNIANKELDLDFLSFVRVFMDESKEFTDFKAKNHFVYDSYSIFDKDRLKFMEFTDDLFKENRNNVQVDTEYVLNAIKDERFGFSHLGYLYIYMLDEHLKSHYMYSSIKGFDSSITFRYRDVRLNSYSSNALDLDLFERIIELAENI